MVEQARPVSVWAWRGVALCAEAQADGVPCTELGLGCETCAQAVKDFSPEDLAALRQRLLKRERRP